MIDRRQFLEFAVDAAWQAGRLTLAHYQTGVAVQRKPDRSLVTVADRNAEQRLRELIGARFPEHTIIGEEFGQTDRQSTHRWVIDPIDGTNTFVRGVPFYGVLLALEIEGTPVVGVTYFPALDEMIAAAQGIGCYWNGRRARVSTVATLSEACIAYTDGRGLRERLDRAWDVTTGGEPPCSVAGVIVMATAWSPPAARTIMLDPRMNPWDCAALIPILQEAGGRFTDWKGRVTIDGGDAVSTNGALHDEVLARLQGSR